MEAYLDVSIMRCPTCGTYFGEASWYAISLESDLECGKCGTRFSAKRHLTDRALIRFELSKAGKVKALDLTKPNGNISAK